MEIFNQAGPHTRVVRMILVIILIALYGIVGHLDFEDAIRAEYAHKCPGGEVVVRGSNVLCRVGVDESVIGEI